MDLVVADAIVRPAHFVPIANRRNQAYRDTVADQRPAGGMQRGVNRDPATARAEVFARSITTAGIKLAGVQLARNFVHELRLDPEQLHDEAPRQYELMSLLPSITYSQLSSRSKSQ